MIPALTFHGIPPAAPAGLESTAVAMLVLAGLLCMATVLLFAARRRCAR